MKNAFTMIELIFVIVVLGILSAVAIPKFAASRTDAVIAKTRSDISSIRAAIVTERQSRLIRGEKNYISQLHTDGSSTFFDTNGSNQLLMYGIKAIDKDEHWQTSVGSKGTDVRTYTFKILNTNVDFDYNSTVGTFDCNHTAKYCSDFTE